MLFFKIKQRLIYRRHEHLNFISQNFIDTFIKSDNNIIKKSWNNTKIVKKRCILTRRYSLVRKYDISKSAFRQMILDSALCGIVKAKW